MPQAGPPGAGTGGAGGGGATLGPEIGVYPGEFEGEEAPVVQEASPRTTPIVKKRESIFISVHKMV